MNKVFKSELPTGYTFTDRHDILPDEIMRLRESVGWDVDTPERLREIMHTSLGVVGVRDKNDELVGMACLAGNVRHAVICDLAVNPNHQKQGIGEAIMAKIYELIDENDIYFVYAELSETNPFRDKMITSGFKNTGNSLFLEC